MQHYLGASRLAGTKGSKTIMMKALTVLILAATLLAGCFPLESMPQQQTTTTTTTSCPAGTQLLSNGMCG